MTSPSHVTAARAGPATCLLVNPRSFTVVNSRLAARAIALAKTHGAAIVEAGDPDEIADGLERALAQGTRRLFVLSGDGTIQAIVDCLARLPAGTRLPQLLVLAGGRTNLTVADLGGRRAVLKKLEDALICCARDPDCEFQIEHRHTLAIEQPPAPPRHGFFMAAAVVDRVIRSCHRHREARSSGLRTGRFGTAIGVCNAAIPALRGRAPFDAPELDVNVPGHGRLGGPVRLLVATTLVHGAGWFNPYADRGMGALRMTAVALHARGFWRSLPRLLTGRFAASMTSERGYLSGRCESFTVGGLDGYTLDGQSFDTDPARPVVIRTGLSVSFLMP